MNTNIKKYFSRLGSKFRKWNNKLQQKLTEVSVPEYVVFSVYAIITGAFVGLAVVLFHKSIDWVEYLFFEIIQSKLFFLGTAAVILLPVIGMLLQSLMRYSSPVTAKKGGVSEVIKAVAIRGGFIRLRTTLFHFLAPVLNIGSGGTVGPEGPAAQIGGGVASKLGQLLGLPDARKRMFTAAGAGAAIASVFDAPLGGIFFALEIVLLNDFQSATFSAIILASVTADAISRIFLGSTPTFIIQELSILSYDKIYLYAILGILAGGLSILFIRYSGFLSSFLKKDFFDSLPKWAVMAFAGLLVGIAGYFYADIFGIGYEAINQILASALSWEVVLVLLILKFFLVPIILQSGGFGGIFAPSLFMGATFGYLFALIVNGVFNFQVDPTSFVLVGMGAVLGGVNTIPIASILIIFEMTRNYEFILPLMFAVVLSTMIVQVVMKGSVHVRQLEKQGYSLVSGRESSILRQIPVREIMKRDVVLISENTPLPKVISQLLESHHGTFYTVDENNRLVGSISETELRPMITEYEYLRGMLIAGDIARPEVLTVSENDNLDHTLKLFGKTNVDEFPVVSASSPSQVIGSIWRQDVIACYNRESLKYNMADGIAYELKDIKKTGKSAVAGGYSIVERKVPAEFVGKTLSELKLRNRFELEVMMIRQTSTLFEEDEDDNLILPGPDYVIKEDDTLILFGDDEKIAKTNEWNT